MKYSPAEIAAELLQNDDNGLKDLRVHMFEEDEDAHNDELLECIYEEFGNELKQAETILSQTYGSPARTGTEDDDIIPLNGLFRFSIWQVGDKVLYLAAAHEDRGLPVILMIGTATEE